MRTMDRRNHVLLKRVAFTKEPPPPFGKHTEIAYSKTSYPKTPMSERGNNFVPRNPRNLIRIHRTFLKEFSLNAFKLIDYQFRSFEAGETVYPKTSRGGFLEGGASTKDRDFSFHDENLFRNSSRRGNQLAFLDILALIGKPKYVHGK